MPQTSTFGNKSKTNGSSDIEAYGSSDCGSLDTCKIVDIVMVTVIMLMIQFLILIVSPAQYCKVLTASQS